ncbi:MAG: RNA polymerase sigma factor RpoD/SigA [Clostridiales bacterium]|nr:RNA polymerase sigma factor RpoD/SigA [Clostridiales bacterium]
MAADVYSNSFFHEITNYPLLTAEEELNLFQVLQTHTDGEEFNDTQETLITSNLRLVVSVAKKYHSENSSIDLGDLVDEGIIGLMNAITKFDPDQGFRFSTFATEYIKGSILNYLQNNANAFHVSSRAQNEIRQIKKFQNEYSKLHDRMPTIHEISSALNMKPEKVNLLLDASKGTDSLDRSVSKDNDENTTLGDMTSDSEKSSPIYATEQKMLPDATQDILRAVLTERELEIITLLHGLNGEDRLTPKEAGEICGVTSERVRQIESIAFRKLQLDHKAREILSDLL